MDLGAPSGSFEPPEKDRKIQEGSEVGSGAVKEVDLKNGSSTWAMKAKEKKSLKKYEVEVKSQDGKHKVVIPGEILVDSTPLWEDFVVEKFLDIAPHIAKVHMVVNKIWSYGDSNSKVEVYDVDAKMMRFKISNQKAREKVIKRGMWNIAGVPMVVKKWTPKTEEEKQEEEAIPMWVHLKKVPLNMFSWEALSFMTSTVRFPLHLHPETAACSNFEEAKIFVNVDVSKTLPKEIEFSLNGKEFTAEFYYPWLPSRCKICEKWGHKETVCVTKKREKKNEGSGVKASGGARVVGTSPGKEEVKENVVILDDQKEDSEQRKSSLADMVEKDTLESSGEKTIVDNSNMKEKVNGWNSVSPDKLGRTKVTQEDMGVQISASKFSVLSLVDMEEGEIPEEDLHVGGVEGSEEGVNHEITEEDKLEDELLDQLVKVKDKAGSQKGGKRVQKAKAQEILESKRSSRRNH